MLDEERKLKLATPEIITDWQDDSIHSAIFCFTF